MCCSTFGAEDILSKQILKTAYKHEALSIGGNLSCICRFGSLAQEAQFIVAIESATWEGRRGLLRDQALGQNMDLHRDLGPRWVFKILLGTSLASSSQFCALIIYNTQASNVDLQYRYQLRKGYILIIAAYNIEEFAVVYSCPPHAHITLPSAQTPPKSHLPVRPTSRLCYPFFS